MRALALLFLFFAMEAEAARQVIYIRDDFDSPDTTDSPSLSSPELWRTIHEDDGPQIVYRAATGEPGVSVMAIEGTYTNQGPGSDMIGLASNYLSTSHYGNPPYQPVLSVFEARMRIVAPDWTYFDTLTVGFERLRAVVHFCEATPDHNSTVFQGQWNDPAGVGWRTRVDASPATYHPNPVTALSNASDWGEWHTFRVESFGSTTTGYVKINGAWYLVGQTENALENRQIEVKAFYYGNKSINVEFDWATLYEVFPSSVVSDFDGGQGTPTSVALPAILPVSWTYLKELWR